MVDAIESVEFVLVASRDRGAAGRAGLHQAVPPALQHPPARRQVLSVHRDLDGRGLPARLLHARAPPAQPRLLRPVLERQARPRHARPAGQDLPVPLLPGRGARAARRARRAWTTTSSAAGRPASATSTRPSYRESIDGVIAFLSGRYREIERDLEAKMKAASAAQDFEQAALERNRLRSVKSLLERQRVANESIGTLDVGGRRGRRRRRQRAGLPDPRRRALRPPVLLPRERHRARHRRRRRGVRPAVLRRPDVDPGRRSSCRARSRSPSCSRAALGERRGARVEVRTAERGDKRRILELAERNALLALDQEKLKAERRRQQRVESLDGLQEALGLDALPLRIECFDISNLMGTHTVASMVVFEGGAPKKSDYRRFTIRGLTEGVPDDFAAMEEVLCAAPGAVGDPAGPQPARPQAQRVLRDAAERRRHRRRPRSARRRPARAAGLPRPRRRRDLAGQAHRGGLRARPPARRSCSPHDTPELQLLQRVRDEAHRFAITHHRNRRDRAMTTSILDDLPGHRPGAQAHAARRTSARPRRCSPRRARSSRRCRACRARPRATSGRHLHRTGD